MEDFAKERLEICKKCPIVKYDNVFGWKCDSKKWLSPDGKEGSSFFKEGWIKGCGCALSHKVSVLSNHCIARKW